MDGRKPWRMVVGRTLSPPLHFQPLNQLIKLDFVIDLRWCPKLFPELRRRKYAWGCHQMDTRALA